MTNNSFDPVSSWFVSFRNLGEPSDIFIDIQSKELNLNERVLYPHSQGDGFSCLHYCSRKFNFQLKTKVSKNSQSIFKSLCFSVIHFFSFFYYSRKRPHKVLPLQINKAHSTDTPCISFEISEGELKEIKNKVPSLNTHFVNSLNQTISQHFNINKPMVWLIPVNMRSDLNLDSNKYLERNLVSSLYLQLSPQITLSETHNLLSQALKQKQYWGTWYWQKLPLFLPQNIIDQITKDRLFNNYYVGTFTNLGQWESSQNFEKLLVYANPVLNLPIACSHLKINQNHFFGMRIYPGLELSSAEMEVLSTNWKKNILHP